MSTATKSNNKLPPYMKESMYATRPTRLTVFFRTFLPWQILRFLIINFRMMRMIRLNERSRSAD